MANLETVSFQPFVALTEGEQIMEVENVTSDAPNIYVLHLRSERGSTMEVRYDLSKTFLLIEFQKTMDFLVPTLAGSGDFPLSKLIGASALFNVYFTPKMQKGTEIPAVNRDGEQLYWERCSVVGPAF